MDFAGCFLCMQLSPIICRPLRSEALCWRETTLEYQDKMLGEEPSVRGIHSILAPLSIISSYVFARHAMLVDQRTESVTVPLNVSLDAVGKLELANSMFLFFSSSCKISSLHRLSQRIRCSRCKSQAYDHSITSIIFSSSNMV